MNFKPALGCVVLLTLACAERAPAETTGNIMARWVGRDVNRLLTAWGPPTSTFVMPNGNTMYTWATSEERHVEDAHGLAALFADPDDKITTRWCKQWFTVTPEGTVIDWDYEGNDCD